MGLQDLRMRLRSALDRAAGAGFSAVEIDGVVGETSASALSESGRRQLRRLVATRGMQISSVDATAGHHVLNDPQHMDRRVWEVRAALELAHGVGARVVVCAVGSLVGEGVGEALGSVLAELGDVADRTSCALALRTQGASSEALRGLIDSLACPSVGVCMDPAGLLMAGEDPTAAAGVFAGQVRLSYVRDAVRSGPPVGGRETEVGQGEVEWPAYCGLLDAGGYAGPHIVRCRSARDALEHALRGRATLQAVLAGMGRSTT